VTCCCCQATRPCCCCSARVSLVGSRLSSCSATLLCFSLGNPPTCRSAPARWPPPAAPVPTGGARRRHLRPAALCQRGSGRRPRLYPRASLSRCGAACAQSHQLRAYLARGPGCCLPACPAAASLQRFWRPRHAVLCASTGLPERGTRPCCPLLCRRARAGGQATDCGGGGAWWGHAGAEVAGLRRGWLQHASPTHAASACISLAAVPISVT
jgi:hypothetical protein